MTAPLIADIGGPDGDGPPLCDVLAALGWTVTYTPGRHNTVTDPAGVSLTAHVDDVWALLIRRGLITYARTPYCAACGYSKLYRTTCQCWRIKELPA